MAISLTSAGLYLEPRAYATYDSGNNYGTPRFVSNSTSLGGGSWAGIYNYLELTNPYTELKIKSEYGVSSSSGGFTSESLDNSRKGGGLNVYEWFRHRALRYRAFFRKYSNSSYWSSMFYQKKWMDTRSSIEWKCLRSKNRIWYWLFYRNSCSRVQSIKNSPKIQSSNILSNFLNLNLVKEVA